MSAPTVLITRPSLQATYTAAKVTKLGATPIIMPLSEIIPLAFTLPSPATFDAVLATSAHAFTTLTQDKNRASLCALPLFCVGQQTAHAAHAAGFNTIVTIAHDAENLGSVMKHNRIHHLLYLAGRHRRQILEQVLKTQGKSITICETYDQHPLIPDIKLHGKLLTSVHYALFYSAFAARQAHHLMPLFEHKTKILCLSPRIAAALPQNNATHCLIPTKPNETALMALLKTELK